MLENMDKEFVLNTYNRNYVNFKYGENSTLFDENGKDYIDFTSGIGVCSVGHANHELNQTITAQLGKISHISNLYLIEPQAKLAKALADRSPMFDDAVFFANSGAEANECAIKIARKYGKRNGDNRYKIITLENSFHGRTLATLKATGQVDMQEGFEPFPDGFEYAKDLDDIIPRIDEKTVAVMIELIQGEGGVEPLDKGKIQALESTLKAMDVLLIIDEVQTGIYRTGQFLASNYYEITPDIITMAKGLGGGLPIGAVLTDKKDVLVAGDHGSTFGGNYISTTAGLTVLNILENKTDLDENIDFFESNLQKIFNDYVNLFEKSVGIGFMQGLRVKEKDNVKLILDSCFKNGLLVLKAGRNTIRLLPPLTITKEEMTEGFQRFRKSLDEI
jgi:acetylornithine/N-succinyldiaminopimelate aminotransferase